MPDVPATLLSAAQTYEAARQRRAEGNSLGAAARYRKAAELTQSLGDLRWSGAILAELGEMHQEAYEPVEARRCCLEALTLFRQAAEPKEAAEVAFRLGQIALLAGDLAEAGERFREAADAFHALAEPQREGAARLALARLYWDQRLPEQAVDEAIGTWSRAAGEETGSGAAEALSLLREWKRRMKPETLRARLDAAAEGGRLMELLD